jgi:hypothetical protein
MLGNECTKASVEQRDITQATGSWLYLTLDGLLYASLTGRMAADDLFCHSKKKRW